MRKIGMILGLAAILFAIPVFAVSPNSSSQSTQTEITTTSKTKYTDDAQGIRDRIEALKLEREELKAVKKAEIATAAKNVATKKLTAIISKFESIQKRVQNMPTISAERKTALDSQIEAEITKLEALKTELSAATTVTQVNEVMTKVKTQVASSKTIIKDIVDAIHATHLEGVITKLNAVLVKIQKKIDALTGGETAAMKTEKEGYAANIKAAQDAITAKDFKTAKEKLLLAKKNLVKLNQLANAAKNKTTTDDTEETTNDNDTETGAASTNNTAE